MGCSLPGSSIHGILKARILEWVAILFSRGRSPARDWTRVSCIEGGHFDLWATREANQIPHFSGFVLTIASVWNTPLWFQPNPRLWLTVSISLQSLSLQLRLPHSVYYCLAPSVSPSSQNVSFRRARTFLWSLLFLNHLKWCLVQKRGSSVCWWANDRLSK